MAPLFVLCLLGLSATRVLGDGDEVFDGPSSSKDLKNWREGLLQWRNDTIARIGYHGGVYDVPEIKWTQTSFISPLMHPYDRYFFDEKTNSYTVNKFLDDLEARYGGIDSLLLWPTYTNIGIDDRNQFDFFRSMPGGLQTLRKVVSELKARGVRTLLPYNPWDIGTRPEGESDADALASLLKQVDADGILGDTMQYIPEEFWLASTKINHPIALCPEGVWDRPHPVYDEYANWGTMSWGYWWDYNFIPAVDKYKVLDARHMTNICNRWAKSRVDDIQHAFFNAIGYVSWENIWGIWNGIVPVDGEALRRASTILRFFSSEHRALTQSQLWSPHEPVINGDSIFASKFPDDMQQQTVWLFVNRGSSNSSGPQIKVSDVAKGSRWYDCYHGEELKPTSIDANGSVVLSFDIEAHGYGCVFATTNHSDTDLEKFLSVMKSMTARPLASYDSAWKFLPQTQVHIEPTKRYPTAPEKMVSIPGGKYNFKVSGVEIESSPEGDVDVQFAWESRPQRDHSHVMNLDGFYIDKYPVTCAEYKKYLDATGYAPEDSYGFLKTWNNGSYPSGHANKPVTYISLREAREYCSWAGKRLPHEWEWQRAAQGDDGRIYPWGNALDQSKYPVQQSGRKFDGPDDVDAHPEGDSPYGVSDLVGNVWQYTDEYIDDHTRAVILRGSAMYRPSGSQWYFPNALELNKHNKYFLMSDSYERAGTIGFRCVADAV